MQPSSPPSDSEDKPASPSPVGSISWWSGPLKILCGTLLIGFLAWQASRSDGFVRLITGPKDYGYLVAAFGLILSSVVVTFIRWRLIALAAGVPMTFAESLRFGAIGFAMNFVALGNIGGDVVKAALLARGRPGRRALAVTTVMIDRLVGLFGLLLFASGAIFLTNATSSELPTAVRLLCQSTLGMTALSIVCFVLAMAPGRLAQRLVLGLASMPLLRSLHLSERGAKALATMFDTYQQGHGLITGAVVIGLIGDALFILSFYMVAMGLPMGSPGLVPHFFIVPLGLIAGAIPISPNGLGTVEATVEMLYRSFGTSGGQVVQPGDGALIAFGHRLVMLAVGATAVVYYIAEGRQKRAAMKIKAAGSSEG